jgi:alkanesulfonate monooxygenase SsuD/methylene tetrahydromethanopterin reductase-like flavin-dependent oxidoreductase (luciferase family)
VLAVAIAANEATGRMKTMETRSLDFGIFDPTEIPDDRGPDATAAALEAHIADAQLAERVGYRYFFFIEHQNAGFFCISSPTVYLTALARATATIRIGAMIFQVPFHHPIRLAQDVAMIDHLSKGRMEFAIGYGTRRGEFTPWNADYDNRRAMGEEAMEVILKAWREQEVSFQGAYWKFDGAQPQPHPYQREIPVWIGAHSHRSYDYAARKNMNVSQIFEVEKVVAEKFAYFRDAWAKQGRTGPRPRAALVRHVHVAKTDEAARAEAERYMLQGIQGAAGVARALAGRPEDETPENKERLRVYYETSRSVEFWLDEGLAFVGSPETVAAAIRKQHENCGYDVLLINHQFADMPRDLYVKSLKLFGEQVIPAFASSGILSPVSA